MTIAHRVYRGGEVGGVIIIACDECGDDFEGQPGEEIFERVWERAKAAGWTASKDHRGDWTHACPDCQ
jgi:hypothetical protein